jgi:LPS-assembly protein
MCGTTSPYSSVFFSLFLILIAFNTFADNADIVENQVMGYCAADDSLIKHVPPREFDEESIENTEISADYTQSSSDGSTSLDGNVIIEKHLLRVSADHAHYDQQQNTLHVSGNVHLDTPALSLNASAGAVDMDDTGKQGEFNDVMFLIPANNMKGKADTINADDRKQTTLTNASITSCHFLDPDWLISADEISLDLNDEYGSAEDVVIRFKNVPFLYTPYIEFPTSDKRRSGLLFPEFGTSTSRGIELAAPVYWNIAPNQDAVITPHFMDRRGLELGANYRYLTRSTSGELTGAYLPEDDITNETRYQVYYLQHSSILQNLQLDIQYQDISDSDYFNDFSNSLGATSQTVLNRDVTLRYDLKNWHMKALVQDIKTIDTTTPVIDRPYQRLPQLTLNGDTGVADTALLFTLSSEYVDFTHEGENIVTGQRITVTPGLQLPLSGAAWFFKPAVKLSSTQYDINPATSTTPDTESRNLPISNIDAGLFFDRFLDNGYQQTLEPRVYYLYVPYEDQNTIPVFDTNIPDFTVSQLFRDNRFIGGDRIGDANQLTLALTSRISNPNTGNEILRASIGQIFYFEDRKVSLDGTIDTAKQSDIIAEFDTGWGNWQTNIDLQWDVANNNLSKETYFLHYRTDARHLFNIGYRKRMDNNSIDIEQTDTSFVYAISRQYSGIVRWNYSLDERKNIDTIAGIAYDSCCWSIQLLAQSRIQNSSTATSDYDNSVLVQFVFKGLGNVAGSKAKNTLEQSIFGYTDILQ